MHMISANCSAIILRFFTLLFIIIQELPPKRKKVPKRKKRAWESGYASTRHLSGSVSCCFRLTVNLVVNVSASQFLSLMPDLISFNVHVGCLLHDIVYLWVSVPWDELAHHHHLVVNPPVCLYLSDRLVLTLIYWACLATSLRQCFSPLLALFGVVLGFVLTIFSYPRISPCTPVLTLCSLK